MILMFRVLRETLFHRRSIRDNEATFFERPVWVQDDKANPRDVFHH
jgi:hypothetical protein